MHQVELYVVATPLGNRQDITLRAIECLRTVPVIFSEDTRVVHQLLALCGIPLAGRRLQSYSSHNLKSATALAVEILVEQKKSIALVTDRGTPAISDPGAQLVAAAREAGICVRPVPGPSAVTALVSISGWQGSDFYFVGFFPRQNKARDILIEKVAHLGSPVCFYESPRRIQDTVAWLKKACPHGQLFFAREMTKLHEESAWLALADPLPSLPEQGEYALMLTLGPQSPPSTLEEAVQLRLAPDRVWAKTVAAEHGVPAQQVYNALQKLKSEA